MSKILDQPRPEETPPTKEERMTAVVEMLLDKLPLPAKILAQNYIHSFQLSSEENADKIISMLRELADYIDTGKNPDEKHTA
jgi:hypothetical protein